MGGTKTEQGADDLDQSSSEPDHCPGAPGKHRQEASER